MSLRKNPCLPEASCGSCLRSSSLPTFQHHPQPKTYASLSVIQKFRTVYRFINVYLTDSKFVRGEFGTIYAGQGIEVYGGLVKRLLKLTILATFRITRLNFISVAWQLA